MNDQEKALKDALDKVDAATTACGTALTAAQDEYSSLFKRMSDAIANQSDPAALQAMVDEGTAIGTKVQAITDALTPMASDPANPVPVAVPSVG